MHPMMSHCLVHVSNMVLYISDLLHHNSNGQMNKELFDVYEGPFCCIVMTWIGSRVVGFLKIKCKQKHCIARGYPIKVIWTSGSWKITQNIWLIYHWGQCHATMQGSNLVSILQRETSPCFWLCKLVWAAAAPIRGTEEFYVKVCAFIFFLLLCQEILNNIEHQDRKWKPNGQYFKCVAVMNPVPLLPQTPIPWTESWRFLTSSHVWRLACRQAVLCQWICAGSERTPHWLSDLCPICPLVLSSPAGRGQSSGWS